MKKADFYNQLKNIGVDISSPEQMKVWSLALLAMGQDYLLHKTERCHGCYFEDKAIINGAFDFDACPNSYCPLKALPSTPAEVVDHLFALDVPLDMAAFYHKYVDPILQELIKQEEEQNNAR